MFKQCCTECTSESEILTEATNPITKLN